MIEEPVKQAVKREANGRFPQGISGNPNGRPKKKGTLIELLEQRLEELGPGKVEKTYKELIVESWPDVILGRGRAKLPALQEALNRLYGKPKESIELSSNPDKPVTLKVIYDDGDKR